MVLYEGIAPCRCGGIGRRTGLKIPRRKSYGFDPRHRYHVRRSKHRSVSASRRKLHYVSSFFLSKSNPLRWASIWFPPESKHRSVSALRRKLHYVSSFFLSKSNPLRWASIWFLSRSKHRSVSALRRKLHYVSSFFLSKSNPLRWASIWFYSGGDAMLFLIIPPF